MKNNFLLLLLTCLFVGGFSSCIKDEPLYREADIVSFKIENEYFVSASISNDHIQLLMLDTDTVVFKSMTPIIETSLGATVSPASGVSLDFTEGVTYKVVSEDGNYSREYTVSLAPIPDYKYDFDEWVMRASGSWEYPALADPTWASANQGILLAKGGTVDEFPTQGTTDSKSGKCAAVLKTQQGGTYFWQKIPIFSGSLFTGNFVLRFPQVLKSTEFGQPHPKEKGKPVTFTGYYKYAPGETFIGSDGNSIPGRVDECSINAVLYKMDKGTDLILDGTNIYDSPNVVAHALLEDKSEKKEYTQFSIDFVYNEELDFTTYDYKLAVIFASSARGDYYEGAVGSTLTIDDVEVVCEAFNE